MKKIFLLAFSIIETTLFAQSNDDIWLGKDRSTKAVQLYVTENNTITNRTSTIETKAESIQQIISLDDHTDLTIILHRAADDTLILQGEIPWKISQHSDRPPFGFKCHLKNVKSPWRPYLIIAESTYENSTIRLVCHKASLGLISIVSLVKRLYDHKYDQLLWVGNDPICTVENNVERHIGIDQSEVDQVKLESIKTDKKIRAKFSLSDNNDMKEFAYITVKDPGKKATNFNCTVRLLSTTSGEELDTKIFIE